MKELKKRVQQAQAASQRIDKLVDEETELKRQMKVEAGHLQNAIHALENDLEKIRQGG